MVHVYSNYYLHKSGEVAGDERQELVSSVPRLEGGVDVVVLHVVPGAGAQQMHGPRLDGRGLALPRHLCKLNAVLLVVFQLLPK